MSEEQSPKNKRRVNPYMRYTGMAIQMGATIGLGAWAGSELDKSQQMEKPIWTIVFSLLGVAISLYLVIRSVNRLSNED